MISIALTLHVLAAVVWVGGMFFAYVLLQPVLGTIDSHQRLTIWVRTLERFFRWVWLCIIVLLATGFYMIHLLGGFFTAGNHIYVMLGLAVIMIAIFKFIYAAPFRHLRRGVEEGKWEVAAYALGTIRILFAVSLGLGVLTIISATTLAGRF